MSFLESDIQKERLLRSVLQKLRDERRDIARMIALHRQDGLVANRLGTSGDVLHSRQRRCVAHFAQGVENMPGVIVQRESAMRQTEHAAVVSALSGKQTGAARRAGGRGAKCLSKQYAFVGQFL